MRHILILLAFTCAPAFCQDDSLNSQFHYNPQWFPKVGTLKIGTLKPGTLKPLPVMKLQIVQTETACSIPLLNAKPAGIPVHMPELRTPQGATGAADHMAVKPPAPACPAR
jgi:hypothetical protein